MSRYVVKIAFILLAVSMVCIAVSPGKAMSSARTVKPFPAALKNHPYARSFTPAQLYAWRFPQNEPGGKPCNPSHVKQEGRDVSVQTNGKQGDCGVIQSPHEYPTGNGYVYEARVYFSSMPKSSKFADWNSYWMYGNNWPVDGETDAVETTFGTQFVTYRYGKGNSTVSTCNRANGCDDKAGPLYPQSPNIRAGWHTVDIAYGWKRIQIFYDGRSYVSIAGRFVTMKPAWIVFSAGSDSSMDTIGIPGNVKVAWVRIFA